MLQLGEVAGWDERLSAHFLVPIVIKGVVEIRLTGVGEGMKRIAEPQQPPGPGDVTPHINPASPGPAQLRSRREDADAVIDSVFTWV